MVQEHTPVVTTSESSPNSWHTQEPSTVLTTWNSSLEDGLTDQEAVVRLEKHGRNVLERKVADGPLVLLWRQINNPLIWVLIASSVIAFVADPKDGLKNGLVILAVVVLNAIIGFVQEFRAGKAIEALKDFVPEFATVLRNGTKKQVPVAEIVPGDIVSVMSGDRVPADMRLVQCRTLLVEEAALTGESVPVEKKLDSVAEDATLGDRKNMAYGGTLVTQGAGLGVVVATAGDTELGRINTMLNEATETETPLSRSLSQIGTVLSIGIGVVALLILVLGTARGVGQGLEMAAAFRESVIFAITLAVGAIPEGLPAIVTIALAIGVQRMAARKAVVRKLPSVETLGSTTVICSDKTGTLTKNEMTVQSIVTVDGAKYTMTGVGYEPVGDLMRNGEKVTEAPADVALLLKAAALCSDATLEDDNGIWRLHGDPTEGALVVAAEKLGYASAALRKSAPRIDAIPFESEYQFMATLQDYNGQRWIFMKGSPEAVLKRSTGMDANAVLSDVTALASQGQRVLGIAGKKVSADHAELAFSDVDQDMEFLGLAAMIDPPRKEVIEAIRLVHGAGVTVKMITGDHAKTAEAIGEQLNIADGRDAITGTQLAEMDDAQIRVAAKSTNVFARVAPEHKLRLVRALQEEGQVTAMTGDGVNDAPALKQSDIGVAMGITGTSVSKESADIVLADDNFASIVAAVEEGRRVYDNLIKSLAFVLPTNLGLAMILMAAVAFFPFVGGELLLPMLPTQILWINLVATVALALPLAFESKEPDIMSRPPRNKKEPVLSGFVIARTFIAATLMTVSAVGLFLWQYNKDLPLVQAGQMTMPMLLAEAQTMAVTTVIFFQIFYMLNCRSLRDSIFRIGLFSNKSVFAGIAAVLVLQAAFIYFPPLQAVFSTAALTPMALLVSAVAGMLILPVITVEKLIRGRKRATV